MKTSRTAYMLTMSAAMIAPAASLFAPPAARADGLLFSYEGDILPGDPGSGFEIFNPCDGDCSRHLEDGHFVLEWGPMGNLVNYSREIARSPDVPPPTLWVEWRFRSNQPKPPTSSTCDASVTVTYRGILDLAYMLQDAVVDQAGDNFVLGLSPEFHTYRFESLDGVNYTFAVDGTIFKVDSNPGTHLVSYVQFSGEGGCPGYRPQPVRNEWDFVRYGTIGSGEQLVSADPPAGNLTPAQANQLSSVILTFDQPTYLYVNDITVTTTGSTPPTVTATRRLDNGAPEVLEVVLHGPLPPGETTTFTLDTGTGPQSVSYFREQPEVPAASAGSLALMLLLALAVGTIIVRRSFVRE